MLNKVTTHIEQALPKSWTANTITIVGNSMLYVAGALAMVYGGLTYAPTAITPVDDQGNPEKEYLPLWCFWFAAFAV